MLPFPLLRASLVQISVMVRMTIFDTAVLHWLLSLGDPEAAIGQCECGSVTVETDAPATGPDNAIPDI